MKFHEDYPMALFEIQKSNKVIQKFYIHSIKLIFSTACSKIPQTNVFYQDRISPFRKKNIYRVFLRAQLKLLKVIDFSVEKRYR